MCLGTHKGAISIAIQFVCVGSTNSEFNFRHDWNSLISDDDELLMKHYTKDYFPRADVYVSLIHAQGCRMYKMIPT